MVKEYVLHQDISAEFNVKKGISYRYMNEMYLVDDVQKIIQQDGIIKEMNKYDISVDTLGGKH